MLWISLSLGQEDNLRSAPNWEGPRCQHWARPHSQQLGGMPATILQEEPGWCVHPYFLWHHMGRGGWGPGEMLTYSVWLPLFDITSDQWVQPLPAQSIHYKLLFQLLSFKELNSLIAYLVIIKLQLRLSH